MKILYIFLREYVNILLSFSVTKKYRGGRFCFPVGSVPRTDRSGNDPYIKIEFALSPFLLTEWESDDKKSVLTLLYPLRPFSPCFFEQRIGCSNWTIRIDRSIKRGKNEPKNLQQHYL